MMTERDGRIEYQDRPPHPLVRIFLVLLGLWTIFFTCVLLWTIRREATLSAGTALMALLCLVLAAAGMVFVLAGLNSATDLGFDPVANRLNRRCHGPVRNRRDSFRLSDLAPPELVMNHNTEDDEPFAMLRLILPDGGRFDMTGFADRHEAEAWRGRIARLLLGPNTPRGGNPPDARGID